MFQTVPGTKCKIFAIHTNRREFGFSPPKVSIPDRRTDIFPRVGSCVAEFQAGIHKKVTRVDITVVFDHVILAAIRFHLAVFMYAGYKIGDNGIEQPNRNRPNIAFKPLIKDVAKELPPCFSKNRKWCRLTSIIEFHTGDILMVKEAGIPEICVDFLTAVDIGIRDKRENIEFGVIPLQAFQTPDYVCMGPFSDFAFSMMIMDISGAVKTDTQ